jgi:hypothetical protein
METLFNLARVLVRPRQTCRALLQKGTLRPALVVVLAYGLLLSALFARSHLAGEYPPPPDELATWVEAWGAFAMLPAVKIPAEQYRLAQALFALPLVLAAWLLMAGSARVLSDLWGGRASFVAYANLFGHTFFSCWILATLLDALYSLALGDRLLPALRGAYGPQARALVTAFPSAMWTGLLGLGAAYNGIAAFQAEEAAERATGGRAPRCIHAALIAVVSGAWPIGLISLLIR